MPALRVQSSLDGLTEISGNSHKMHSPVKKEHTNTTPELGRAALLGNFQSTASGRRGRENCIKYVWPGAVP